MANKYIRIGSSDNMIGYNDDDWDAGIELDAPIKAGAPIDGNDVVRLDDIYDPVIDLLSSRAYGL